MKENLVEAVLFLTPKPLPVQEIARVTGMREEEVEEAIRRLRERYEGTALQVEEFMGSYRLNVREEFADIARKMGLLPEFSEKELRIVAEILKRGALPLSEIKRRYGRWEELLAKLKAFGFVVVRKEGRKKVVRKTRLMERYFGLASEDQ